MAWKKGFNFRASSGYVTDGTDETYANYDDPYPRTRNSVTFGFTASGTDARDRNNSVDRRLAGMAMMGNGSGTTRDFRVDLPAAGDYKIRLAIGEASFSSGYHRVEILDNTTSKFTILDTNGTAGGHFDDATGTDYATANWPASNTQVTHTFETTTLIMRIGATSSQADYTLIAHLEIEQVVTESTGTLSKTLDALTCSATGTVGSTTGTLSQTLGALTLVATGTVPLLPITGSTKNAAITLAWNAVAGATGYRLYIGTASGVYSSNRDVGNVLTYRIENLPNNTYYFVVAAYDAVSESGYSNEITDTITAADGLILGSLMLTATGSVISAGGITGTLAQTLAPLTSVGTGTLSGSGALGQTLAPLTLVAAGTVTTGPPQAGIYVAFLR